MTDVPTLKVLKERSQKRRRLLAQQGTFFSQLDEMLGAGSSENLSSVLGFQDDRAQVNLGKNRRSVPETEESQEVIEEESKKQKLSDLDAPGENDELSEELMTYTDSSTFLKGTQSANPHNDYCQHYVDTGHRPQNFIRDVGLADRFEEYPKLKELIRLKDELIAKTATPPMLFDSSINQNGSPVSPGDPLRFIEESKSLVITERYLKCDLETFDIRQLNCKFDVILVEAPLEEYQRTYGMTNMKFWTWEEIMKLEIEEIAASRSFVFLWCGSSDGLDLGRQCLKKWGFRRCEDICWIKTNIKNPGHSKNLEARAIFQRTKEHCLMGIKGTVRRSTDGDFIHANIDIDLIISEEPEYGSIEKPEEIFHIIEHFCLGRRRLHVFGRDVTIRPGWLSIGPELTNSNFNSEAYNTYFNKSPTDFLTGCTERIEALRPKSPPPKNKGGVGSGSSNRGGNSRGGSGRPKAFGARGRAPLRGR